MNQEVKEIILAGFDGYSHDAKENYAVKSMEFITKSVVMDAMNEGLSIMLRRFEKDIKLTFLTTPRYINL